LPDLAGTAREYADDVVVVTLTTSPQDDQERINKAMGEHRSAFIVGRPNDDTHVKLRNVEGGGRGIPYTAFIDRDGNVREVHRGGATQAYLSGVAAKLTQ
jgi:hypothetical protein